MKHLLTSLLILLSFAGFAQKSLPVSGTLTIGNSLSAPAMVKDATQQYSPLGAARVNTESIQQTYSSGAINFTPAATPTDIAALQPQSEGRICSVKTITITAYSSETATTAIDVLLQKSPNGGGGTSASQPVGRHDILDTAPTGGFIVFSANRTSGGNGISTSRPLIRQGKLLIGTANNPGTLTWNFSGSEGKGAMTRNLVDWVVINLNGQTMPTGTRLSISITWTEEQLPHIFLIGDSTTSNAIFLFQYIWNQPGINSRFDLRNYGSNGFRAVDILLNTNGVTYPLSAAINASPEQYGVLDDIFVINPGINDVRTGQTSQAQLISILDAMIFAIRTGTVSGQTYTSPVGAGTTFTWPSTMVGNPDRKIILWGPNPLCSDDPASVGWMNLTGQFAGMTLAQAAQSATDIMYNAYDFFKTDPRVYRVIQKQDVLGRTSKTVSASGDFTDQLHPLGAGQKKIGKQIVPVLLQF